MLFARETPVTKQQLKNPIKYFPNVFLPTIAFCI